MCNYRNWFASFWCTFFNKFITLLDGCWFVQPKYKLILVKIITIIFTWTLKTFDFIYKSFHLCHGYPWPAYNKWHLIKLSHWTKVIVRWYLTSMNIQVQIYNSYIFIYILKPSPALLFLITFHSMQLKIQLKQLITTKN